MADYKNIPVLITGAEGFVGSNLSAEMARRGARLGLLVHPRSRLDRLEGLRNRAKFFPVDIRRRVEVERAVKKFRPRRVFHLAAFADPARDWKYLDRALAVNLGGSVNLVRALEGTGYEVMVAACTAEVYGRNRPPFRENLPADPVSPYSFSKAAAADFFRMSAATFGARIAVARFFLIYGPGQGEEKFLPQLIESALTGNPLAMTAGRQTREYLHIDDAVAGLLAAAENGRRDGSVYNLGTGRETSLRGLVAEVEKLTGRKVKLTRPFLPYRPNEIRRLVGDHRRARRELRWRPVKTLAEGLAETITLVGGSFQASRRASP